MCIMDLISIICLGLFAYAIWKRYGNKPLKGFSHKDFDDVRRGKNVDDKYREKIYNEKREMDRILEKISKSGMGSISVKEKEFLDRISNKVK